MNVKLFSGTMANKVTILSSRNLESRELSVSQGPRKKAGDTDSHWRISRNQQSHMGRALGKKVPSRRCVMVWAMKSISEGRLIQPQGISGFQSHVQAGSGRSFTLVFIKQCLCCAPSVILDAQSKILGKIDSCYSTEVNSPRKHWKPSATAWLNELWNAHKTESYTAI